MNTTDIERLALAIHALRPDWAASSLRSFITNQLGDRPTYDATIALTVVALDSDSRTPARVLEQGPWWTILRPQRTETETPIPARYQPEHIEQAGPESVADYTAAIRAHLTATKPPPEQRTNPTQRREARR